MSFSEKSCLVFEQATKAYHITCLLYTSTDFNGGILGADNPTFHATIGWDWIPTVRGRNIGIWNDVFLTSTGKVTVADPLVTSVLPLPDTTSATLTAEVIVKNHDANTVNLSLIHI